MDWSHAELCLTFPPFVAKLPARILSNPTESDMLSFFFRKPPAPLIQGKTSAERVLRFVGLFAVIIVVMWLFWKNSEHTMRKIQSRGAVVDQTGTLTQEQKKALGDFAQLFKSDYGLELKIFVAEDHLSYPDLDAKTIFIGLVPSRTEAVVELPPLLAKALGPDLARTLTQDHFPHFYETGQWPQGLAMALERLWDAMQHVGAPPGQ